MATIHITGDETADRILSAEPFALLLGMLLDQQYPMEQAFRGPAKIVDRFGSLDPHAITEADPEEFATMCATTPAVHRFPRSMAGRIQAVARIVVEEYDGHAERLWDEATSGAELVRRVEALPGFGKQKAKISPRWLPSSSTSAPRAGSRRSATTRWRATGRRGRGRSRLLGEGARLQEGQEGSCLRLNRPPGPWICPQACQNGGRGC